jgi:hypothetical protein
MSQGSRHISSGSLSKRMFTHQDSKCVDMVLNHMNITGNDRDREAQFVVRSINRVIGG